MHITNICTDILCRYEIQDTVMQLHKYQGNLQSSAFQSLDITLLDLKISNQSYRDPIMQQSAKPIEKRQAIEQDNEIDNDQIRQIRSLVITTPI